ncbi:MAG: gliding motility-associated C-terminal domain-containing protein, partial [Saprospiraceae bacterium]|nr:gliding motility-associated C-terminal domain-containing protein [Saprospiraceae bacterium]
MFIVNVNSTKDCDTTKIFHIQVSPPRLTAQNITICEGESYFINNKRYSQTGFYLDTLISAKGCDSIVQTFLKINPKDTNSQIIIKCENKQITINGIQIEDSGEYSFPFKNRYGCDSTLKIEVRNKPLSSFFVDTLLCIGQNLIIKNRIYNEEGNYIDTLIGQNQCDSFVSTIIKLKDCNHIFVPNVFSPNGDGLNDKFEIFGEGIESLYVEIYSRWGELLFKSDQLNV